MKIKRILNFLLALGLVGSMAVMPAFASDGTSDEVTTTEDSTFDDDFEYNDESDFVFTYDTENKTATLSKLSGNYSSEDGTVNIPPTILDGEYTVVAIAKGAFEYNDSIVSVTLPSTVKTIGSRAFYGCDSLVSINLDSVTTIVDYAFGYCDVLTDVGTLENVTTVGSGAFAGSPALQGVTVSSNLAEIGDYAFGYSRGSAYNASTTFAITYLEYEDNGNWENLLTYIGKNGLSTPTKVVVGESDVDPYANCHFDVDNNGEINAVDLLLLKKKLLQII